MQEIKYFLLVPHIKRLDLAFQNNDLENLPLVVFFGDEISFKLEVFWLVNFLPVDVVRIVDKVSFVQEKQV